MQNRKNIKYLIAEEKFAEINLELLKLPLIRILLL